MLLGGHAACILLERVEKPTDNKPRGRFVTVADADSPGAIGPSLARRVPHSPPALGPMTISTAGKELNTATLDMRFPLSHPRIGEVGRDADELSGSRNPRKRDDVGRHGAPT